MYIFDYIYTLIIIVSFCFALYLAFWKKKNEQQRYFYLYLFMVIVVDFVIFNWFREVKTLGHQIFGFLSILYFTWFYYTFYYKRFKIFALLLGITAFVLSIYFQSQNGWEQVSNKFLTVYAICLFTFSFIWFIQSMINTEEVNILHKFPFWISIGLMLWSGFFIFRGFSIHYIYEHDPSFSNLIHKTFNFVNIITYSLIFVGLYMLFISHKTAHCQQK